MSEGEGTAQEAPRHRRDPKAGRRGRQLEISIRFAGVSLEVKGWRGLVTLATVVVVGGAVAQQMRLPRAQRTWHGHVFGVVPYDFRLPSLGQLRASVWDPSNPRLFTDKVLGVGWNINLARLFDSARGELFESWRALRRKLPA